MNRRVPTSWKSLPVAAFASSCLGLLLFAGPASAANVVNGGFESGTLEGWHQTSANVSNAGEWSAISGTEPPISGRAAAISEVKREIAALEAELERLEAEEEPTESVEHELEGAESQLEEIESEPAENWATVLPPFEGNFDAVADEEDESSMILYQDVALDPGVPQQLSYEGNRRPCASEAARATKWRVSAIRSRRASVTDGLDVSAVSVSGGRNQYVNAARASCAEPESRHAESRFSHSSPSTGTCQSRHWASDLGESPCAATPNPPSRATSSTTSRASPASGYGASPMPTVA